jgi:hypothetical protein
MNQILPILFSIIVSGMVAAAVICLMVCGVLDGLSRLSFFRGRRGASTSQAVRQL